MLKTRSHETAGLSRRALISLAGAAALLVVPAGYASAQDFPNQRVRIIVPVAPGGSLDIQARTLAQHLTESWGQSVVVETHPGAGSTVGGNIVARATPDGHTLLVGWDALSINEALGRETPFDLRSDLAPVTQTISASQVLVVRPDLGAQTLDELLDLARERPGEINIATPGAGSPGHLALELLQERAEVDFNIAHYSGGGPAIVDLLGSHVDGIYLTLPPALPHVQSGAVTALIVSTEDRASSLPDVPTAQEEGIDDYVLDSWQGILAPAGTPDDVIARIRDDIVEVLEKEDVRELLLSQCFEIIGNTPEEFQAVIEGSVPQWQAIVDIADIEDI